MIVIILQHIFASIAVEERSRPAKELVDSILCQSVKKLCGDKVVLLSQVVNHGRYFAATFRYHRRNQILRLLLGIRKRIRVYQ
jgi:hypothetical protein